MNRLYQITVSSILALAGVLAAASDEHAFGNPGAAELIPATAVGNGESWQPVVNRWDAEAPVP